MILFDLLFIVVLAVIFTALLSGPGRWRHPRMASAVGGMVFLFLLFTVGMLAAVNWVGPMGPMWLNIHWSVPLVTGVLILLLVLALAEPAARERRWKGPVEPDEESAAEAEAVSAGFGIFFWILLVSLVLLAVFGGPS